MRFAEVIEERIQAIKTPTPLTQDLAVITSHRLQTQVLVDQLCVAVQASNGSTQIAAIASTLPDYALFSALRGAGEAAHAGRPR